MLGQNAQDAGQALTMVQEVVQETSVNATVHQLEVPGLATTAAEGCTAAAQQSTQQHPAPVSSSSTASSTATNQPLVASQQAVIQSQQHTGSPPHSLSTYTAHVGCHARAAPSGVVSCVTDAHLHGHGSLRIAQPLSVQEHVPTRTTNDLMESSGDQPALAPQVATQQPPSNSSSSSTIWGATQRPAAGDLAGTIQGMAQGAAALLTLNQHQEQQQQTHQHAHQQQWNAQQRLQYPATQLQQQQPVAAPGLSGSLPCLGVATNGTLSHGSTAAGINDDDLDAFLDAAAAKIDGLIARAAESTAGVPAPGPAVHELQPVPAVGTMCFSTGHISSICEPQQQFSSSQQLQPPPLRADARAHVVKARGPGHVGISRFGAESRQQDQKQQVRLRTAIRDMPYTQAELRKLAWQ